MTRDQLRLRGPRVELPEAPERDRLVELRDAPERERLFELRDIAGCDRLVERPEPEDVVR